MAYRRRGIARALVKYAENIACQAGAPGLVVLTSLANPPALAFYHALGYQDDDLALWKDIVKEKSGNAIATPGIHRERCL